MRGKKKGQEELRNDTEFGVEEALRQEISASPDTPVDGGHTGVVKALRNDSNTDHRPS